MDFLLNRMIISIGFIIKSFATDQEKRTPKTHPWMKQSVCTELLKNLITKHPPLIIYLLEYKISKENISTYFSSPPSLNKLIENKIKSHNSENYIEFIDFLFIIYPYCNGTFQQIMIIFFSENYYFKTTELLGNKYLMSSGDLWKYEIMTKIIKEFKFIVDSKKFFNDLNIFWKFQDLQMILIAFLNSNSVSTLPINKEFQNFEDHINRELFEICLTILNECKEGYHYGLLTSNCAVFFNLFKKVHNRMVKMNISKQKSSQYEKKDMKYKRYNFYY